MHQQGVEAGADRPHGAGGGNEGKVLGSTDVARQCLQKLCRIFDPANMASAWKEARRNRIYTCSKCHGELKEGHVESCLGLADQL